MSFVRCDDRCSFILLIVDPFRVIAHRGASAYAPENTMAVFRKAVELGAPEVETDVGFTKDGGLILFHDGTLDRTTNGHGVPSDYTLAELKELDAGSWMKPEENPGFAWDRDFSGERLSTLDELFREFGNNLIYHVELKDRTEGLVPAVIDCVRRYDLVDRVFIAIINDEEPLLEAKRLEPGINTSLAPHSQMREMGGQGAIEYIAHSGHDMVTLNARSHSRELVDVAHRCGIEARSSGIRNHDEMVEAVECGCNGMTINWPDWLLSYIASM